MPKTDQRLAHVTAALAPLLDFAADDKNVAKSTRNAAAQKRGKTFNLASVSSKLFFLCKAMPSTLQLLLWLYILKKKSISFLLAELSTYQHA